MSLDAGFIQLALAVLALVPGVLALWRTRRKDAAEADKSGAEAADQISDTALSLIKPLKEELAELHSSKTNLERRIAELEWNARIKDMAILDLQNLDRSKDRRISQLETEQEDLICGINRLIEQIEGLGQVPVWRPPRK